MKRVSLFLMAALLLTGAASAQTNVPAALQKKFPSLRVQPKVATKRDPVQGSFYMQKMTITPSVIVEGAATQPQGAMEATMLIIAMDTGAKYRERREIYKVHAAETIQIAAVDKAIKRELEFRPSKTQFDSYRDTSNVGGAVYKWYVFGLRDAETKQLLHFETNCVPLQKHTASNPDGRSKFLALATGSLFDTEFK
ncbi:hypothetical protein DES53_10691 [Roseimicrobium gellanilyticum]|uniref:Secreted protein n=1 Tax=Roseimicrobium gellanilyticum TaxID=748857 RepID=A0A366HJ36_9BACT|nr:hypothetical protein [Roseimicrobium gellanilyticum]RBP42385.1 hypothetical protein DES53_10691 [Roseimicrobium gellanilyticum]